MLRFVVGGKKFVLYSYLWIVWVIFYLFWGRWPCGSGPNSEVTTLVKFAWEGKRQKFVACRHDRVGGFFFVWKKLDFDRVHKSQRPRTCCSLVFKKVHFYQIVCVSKSKAPLLQVCLFLFDHVLPRARRLLGFACFASCGKKTYSKQTYDLFFVCFLNALFAYVLFCLLLLIYTFFLFFFFFR